MTAAQDKPRNGNGNGHDRFGPFKKIDILFVVGIGLIVFGAATNRIEYCTLGIGIVGIPVIKR